MALYLLDIPKGQQYCFLLRVTSRCRCFDKHLSLFFESCFTFQKENSLKRTAFALCPNVDICSGPTKTVLIKPKCISDLQIATFKPCRTQLKLKLSYIKISTYFSKIQLTSKFYHDHHIQLTLCCFSVCIFWFFSHLKFIHKQSFQHSVLNNKTHFFQERKKSFPYKS